MDYLKIEASSDHPLIHECQTALLDQIWKKFKLPTSGRLLDLGPGKGFYTKYFLLHGFTVECVDIDPALRQFYLDLGAGFHVADLRTEQLPFPEASLDLIWCSHVIEHLLDPHQLLVDLRRVLRPGGYAILRTPNLARVRFDFWDDPTHVHPFIKSSLRKTLILAGFEPVVCTICELPAIRGLHRIRAYRWAPWLLFTGSNLLGIGRRNV